MPNTVYESAQERLKSSTRQDVDENVFTSTVYDNNVLIRKIRALKITLGFLVILFTCFYIFLANIHSTKSCTPKDCSTNSTIVPFFAHKNSNVEIEQISFLFNSTENVCGKNAELLWDASHPLSFVNRVIKDEKCKTVYYLGNNYFILLCSNKTSIYVIINQFEYNEQKNIFSNSIRNIEFTWEQFCSLSFLTNRIIAEIDILFFTQENLRTINTNEFANNDGQSIKRQQKEYSTARWE